MKAVSCIHGTLEVVDLPAPRPGDGQLVLEVLRCGICGSDLHAKDHADQLTEVMAEGGYHDFMRSDTPVVMGHEFCGVVAERGRKVGKELAEGKTVVSFPLRRAGGGVHLVGLSPLTPGAYAEQVVTEAALTFVVPNGLDPAVAALTEPMSVALHAVRRSEITGKDVAIVLGCGPVGLAVICHLKARGVRTIVASDFSPGGGPWRPGAAPTSSSTPPRSRRTRRCRRASAASPSSRRSTNSVSARWRSCAGFPAGRTCTGSPTASAGPRRSAR